VAADGVEGGKEAGGFEDTGSAGGGGPGATEACEVVAEDREKN